MTNALFNGGNDDQIIAGEIEALKAKHLKEDGTIDVDSLLKAKAHADRHINRIETEQAGLREDLKVRTTLEDLVSRLQTPNNVNQEPPVNSPNTPHSEIDVKKAIKEELSEFQRQAQYQQNIAYVQAELMKTWGSDYTSKLKAKARELGESEDDLGALAASKPKVFLALVGAGEKQIYNPAPPSSHRITSSGNHAQSHGIKGKAYYDKMRRENPSLYWEVSTQKALHAEAEQVGMEVWSKS